MQETAAVIVDFPVGRPGKASAPGENLPGSLPHKGPVPHPSIPVPLHFRRAQHLAWAPLAGRITLARTIDVFEASPLIKSIVLVLDARHVANADKLCRSESWCKIAAIVAGGPSRQVSILRGLDAVAEKAPGIDWVMIHDAARPLVTSNLLETGLQAAQKYQAATAAVPVKDTIKQVQQGQITATLDRSQLWTIQTPQVFSFALLHQAHVQATAQHVQDSIDDAALLEQLGQCVVVFPGSYTNIKISTAEDLLLAETLLQEGL